MAKINKKSVAKLLLLAFGQAISLILLLSLVVGAYLLGYTQGVVAERTNSENVVSSLLDSFRSQLANTPTPEPIVTKESTPQSPYLDVTWGGPQLWDAVNARRVQLGVNPLSNKSEICTIASIRLNQLLELGKLDGHEGFSKIPEDRPDLKWIFEKYNLSEFLVSGAQTPEQAVSLWENTLGHKQLLTGGEYVWGCTYAQNGFGVAIAAY